MDFLTLSFIIPTSYKQSRTTVIDTIPFPLKVLLAVFLTLPINSFCVLFTNHKSSFCTALKSSEIHTTTLLLNVNSIPSTIGFPHCATSPPSVRHWLTPLPPKLKEPGNPKQHNMGNFNHILLADQF